MCSHKSTAPRSRADLGPGDRRDLGLAVDPHRDPTGSKRRWLLDDGPERAVELGSGNEASDLDPGADGERQGGERGERIFSGGNPWSQA